MSGDLIVVRDSVRSMFAAQARLDDARLNGASRSAWAELESLGMTGVGVSEELGGSGGTLTDAATLVFEVGRQAVAVPLAETTMLAGWLDGLAGWSWTGSAETVAPLDPAHARCVIDGNELWLDGSLRAVPWGRVAQRIVVLAEADGTTVQAAIDPSQREVVQFDNIAGEPRDDIRFDALRLSPAQWAYSVVDRDAVRRRGALARSVAMAGAMTAVFDLTVGYAAARKQFGRPISKFQAVQQLLARLAEEVVTAVTAARAAVDAVESGFGTLATMAAKIRVSRSATHVARLAHQIHGAIGVTEEYQLQALTTRLWCWRDDFGNEAEWSAALTALTLSDSASLWDTLTSRTS